MNSTLPSTSYYNSTTALPLHPYPLYIVVIWNIFSALAVIVNILFLLVIRLQKELQRTSYYNFKLFLIINGVILIVTAAFRLLVSNDYFQAILRDNLIFCAATGVFQRTMAVCTATNLLLVSLDRAICVKQCLKHYKKRYFVKMFPYLVCAVFLITPVIFITEGVLYTEAFVATGPGLCTVHDKNLSKLATGASIYQALAFTLIIVINLYTIIIARILILNTFKKIPVSKDNTKNGKVNRGTARHVKCVVEISRSLGAIIAWTVIAWLPRVINSRVEQAGVYNKTLDYISVTLLGAHLLVMPLVYGLSNRTHRKLVCSKIKICVTGKSGAPSTHSTDINTGTNSELSSTANKNLKLIKSSQPSSSDA